MLPELFEICRFRTFAHGVIADIEKVFFKFFGTTSYRDFIRQLFSFRQVIYVHYFVFGFRIIFFSYFSINSFFF